VRRETSENEQKFLFWGKPNFMFIQLKHKSLDVYQAIRDLVTETYKVSLKLTTEEKLRRAALSVKLNFAEGCTRKSPQERKRYFEVSRGSVVEIDAVLETAVDLGYFKMENLKVSGQLLNRCFAMLTKMR